MLQNSWSFVLFITFFSLMFLLAELQTEHSFSSEHCMDKYASIIAQCMIRHVLLDSDLSCL